MLVLSRREKEAIVIGDRITVRVAEIRGNQVRLAIEAPRETRILRSELVDAEVAKIAAA
jgi:carbon storage regulator